MVLPNMASSSAFPGEPSSQSSPKPLDGEQAMKEPSGDWPLDASKSDYDTAAAHCRMIACSPLAFTSRRIESHQDDKTPLAKIDHWGRLIVEYDGLAKNCLNTDALAGGINRCLTGLLSNGPALYNATSTFSRRTMQRDLGRSWSNQGSIATFVFCLSRTACSSPK